MRRVRTHVAIGHFEMETIAFAIPAASAATRAMPLGGARPGCRDVESCKMVDLDHAIRHVGTQSTRLQRIEMSTARKREEVKNSDVAAGRCEAHGPRNSNCDGVLGIGVGGDNTHGSHGSHT